MVHPSDAIVGIDFGAPRRACDQRRKIIAIAARATGWRRYRIDANGMNARMLASPPGWTADELINELLRRPVRVAAFDFPFSVPDMLLRCEKFSADAGYRQGAFIGWRTFNSFVAQRLSLNDPLDFSPFDAWRSRKDRARLWSRRSTDETTGGQPPLKDKFQATFQMTLLGNVLLSRLWESNRYRVLPFLGGRGAGEVIEVFPGATLRRLGLPRYKSNPDKAIERSMEACRDADITLDVAQDVRDRCCSYSSGGRTADHDVADAFVALCAAILHAEGACHMAIDGDHYLKRSEGAICVPSVVG